MIGETTVLVESQDKEGLIPLRRIANRFVDAFDKLLAFIDGRSRMERLIAAALRIYPGELRKFARRGVGIELLEGLRKQHLVYPVTIAKH